jgi:ribulose-5-phosphate 4-epimerase/fuculose-1-phosphate aldolase
VEGRGFVVTGRYVEELVAAAILIEKACRAEMLAPKVGQIHYLNPALCMAEHAVYLASYSKREKEAHDG